MTTATPPRPAAAPPRPPTPGGSAMGTPAIDPVRLFRKYWVVLFVAVFFGAALGVGSHVLLRQYYPIYRAQVIFEVKAPQTAIGEAARVVDEDELVRFMTTQTAIMTSERVLRRATADNQARLRQNARKWSDRFTRGGQFAWQDAMIDLRDTLRARVEPGTNLVSLSLGWKDPGEVAALVGLVKDAYLTDLQTAGTQAASDQVRTLNRAISDLDQSLRDDQKRRDDMIKEHNVDSIETKLTEARQAIDLSTRS